MNLDNRSIVTALSLAVCKKNGSEQKKAYRHAAQSNVTLLTDTQHKPIRAGCPLRVSHVVPNSTDWKHDRYEQENGKTYNDLPVVSPHRLCAYRLRHGQFVQRTIYHLHPLTVSFPLYATRCILIRKRRTAAPCISPSPIMYCRSISIVQNLCPGLPAHY